MNDETSRTGLDRRALLKLASAGAAAFTAASIGASPATAQDAGDWDKTFPKSDRVDHQKVTFANRYGVPLVGDLYLPAGRGDQPLPALAVAGPFAP